MQISHLKVMGWSFDRKTKSFAELLCNYSAHMKLFKQETGHYTTLGVVISMEHFNDVRDSIIELVDLPCESKTGHRPPCLLDSIFRGMSLASCRVVHIIDV